MNKSIALVTAMKINNDGVKFECLTVRAISVPLVEIRNQFPAISHVFLLDPRVFSDVITFPFDQILHLKKISLFEMVIKVYAKSDKFLIDSVTYISV